MSVLCTAFDVRARTNINFWSTSSLDMLRLRQTPELSSTDGLPILLPLINPQFLACPNFYSK